MVYRVLGDIFLISYSDSTLWCLFGFWQDRLGTILASHLLFANILFFPSFCFGTLLQQFYSFPFFSFFFHPLQEKTVPQKQIHTIHKMLQTWDLYFDNLRIFEINMGSAVSAHILSYIKMWFWPCLPYSRRVGTSLELSIKTWLELGCMYAIRWLI